MFFHTGMRRHALKALGGVAASALFLTACSASNDASGGDGGTDASGGDTGEGATLVVYTGQAEDYQINFNPFSPSMIGGVGTIYEPLFFHNKAEVSDPVPQLGTEQSWNEDGTELSVTLRDGVTWSDGEPFTAGDVAFTFELLLEYPSINNSGFDGAVEVVDDTHVVLTFDEASFVKGPDLLGTTIVPQHLWQDIHPEQDVVEEPVGTGAYVLAEFKSQAFSLESNPDYWGGAPAVEQIRYDALSGNQAGADGIAVGSIDWYTGPIPDIQNTNENFPDYQHFTQWQSQTILATCSSTQMGCEGPQTDPAVRHALYYAMDRTQLNNLAFEQTAGEVSPTFSLTPSQDVFVSDAIDESLAPMTADPQRAASILEDAGWVKGGDGIYAKDGERLSLTVEVVTGWTDYLTALDILASQASEAGIELHAAQSSWNEWTERKGSGDFELVIDSLWQGPAPDPYYLYNYFFDSRSGAPVGETAGNNFARYANDDVDAALAELAALPLDDDAARQPHFDAVQQAIVDDMPYIPVLTGGTTSIWNTADFTGWPSDDDLFAFPAIWSDLDAAQVFKNLEPTR